MTDTTDEGRPAATVIIVRERAGEAPEFLMTERASTMAFAAGALVFPGGAVDPADHDLAASLDHGLEPDEAAARIAAIRETLEESGLGVGIAGGVDMSMLVEMRAELESGVPLGDLIAARGLSLDLSALVPFARWHPGRIENAPRVYDTRFYLARAPEDQEPSVDDHENVHLFWGSATAIFARCDAGEARIIFPTRRNLERLGQFACYDDLCAHAASIPIEKVRPWIEERDGGRVLCIPTHLGYPVTSEPMAAVLRA
jgi:8-oxo-dGTP pyrophosphatase MutT (NUDIX family)